MGIVTGLLLLPVTGPVRAFRFLLERLRDEAEAALRDEGRAFAELIDLSMRHTAGQLTDAEHAEQEAELLERLNSIRDYRNELLHGEQDEDALLDDDEMDDGESPDGDWYGEGYGEAYDEALDDEAPAEEASYAAREEDEEEW